MAKKKALNKTSNYGIYTNKEKDDEKDQIAKVRSNFLGT
jgi:hypothetical protein